MSGGEPRKIIDGAANDEVSITNDSKTLVFTRASLQRPSEIYSVPAAGGKIHAVTHMNDELFNGIELTAGESFWFPGAGGEKILGYLVRPPNFDATKKYPVMVFLHGGPETALDDAWSFRWNAQTFAGAGLRRRDDQPPRLNRLRAKIRRRDRPGLLGGKPYEDIMKGVDYVLGKYPFADGTRMNASGGSYGGYMANWIAGHTDRFKCIVTHSGLFRPHVDVWRDGRVMVPGSGVRRHALGQAASLRALDAVRVREKLQDAHTRDSR